MVLPPAMAASTTSSAVSARCPRRKIRTLSLFDGIGTGFIALSQLRLNIGSYYASEIDADALQVTKHHFGDDIHHLGSVGDITEDTINEIGPIDLLMGGSPCTDLSCVNSVRKGIYDAKGTGLLFFEFYRIKTILDKIEVIENRHYYWLFENVAGMELENKNTISKFLGCEPHIIDSGCLSAQNRRRFFWTNLPGVDGLVNRIKFTTSVGPVLGQYLDVNLGRTANVQKVGTITTKRSCLQDGNSRDPVAQDGELSGLFITEIEKVFGFPAHYTDVGDMTSIRRQKLLGRAWSVPVVKAMLQPLAKIFAIK